MKPFWRGFLAGLAQLGAVVVITPFNWTRLKMAWRELDPPPTPEDR